MKIILFILINLFIFTTYTNASEISSKEALIKKANKGNIQAMIKLNKIYLFPQTKEGFEFYKKWYNLVLKNKSSKDLLSFAKVYNEYKSMFINGELKYIDLLEAADKLGNKNAAIIFVNQYKNDMDFSRVVDNYEKPKKFYERIVKKVNPKDIVIKKSNEYSTMDIKNLKKAALKDKYLATRYLLKKYLKDKKYLDDYLAFEKKALKLNESKRALADFFYEYINKTKGIQLLEELAKKGNADAIATLATKPRNGFRYDIKRDSKEKLTDSEERILGILSVAAKGVYEDPNIKIVAKPIPKNTNYLLDDSKGALKWQEFIINDNKPYLISKLRTTISNNIITYDIYKDLREKLEEKEIKEQNIYTLRELSNYYKRKNKKLSEKYLETASKLGDEKSSNDLANFYIFDKRDKVKSNEILEKLASEGKISAINDLAYSFYKSKDIKKAIEYYEIAANAGSSRAIDKLRIIYHEQKNYKEAMKYTQRCTLFDNPSCYFYVGYYHHLGLDTKQNLSQAIKYYKKAYSINKNDYAANNIGQIYLAGGAGVKKNLELAKQWLRKSNINKAKNTLKKLGAK
ncbi:tetratricopeptide repeat protein [Arcobacter sp.]|uniref:tetratricopeptide repeat protein n=1 Tax=unclassified Arcobacter TaxID=2593671 RepID=UPI003B003601